MNVCKSLSKDLWGGSEGHQTPDSHGYMAMTGLAKFDTWLVPPGSGLVPLYTYELAAAPKTLTL